MREFSEEINFIPSLDLGRIRTISDAFKAIDGRFGMVVTVVGEDRVLRGVVSEGDLRRAILNGKPLDTPLEKVMNMNPVVLNIEDLGDETRRNKLIGQIYQRYGTGHGEQGTIPVVNKDNRVIGLVVPEMLERKGLLYKRGLEIAKSGSPQVLVVGGAGYIGSFAVRILLAEGWRVRVLDNMLYMQTSLNGIEDDRLSVLRGDVTNINDVVDAIEGIDAVVYLAEIVGDAACAHRPERALKTNYLSVANMAHLCAYLHINRFIYASSCSVYGGSGEPDKYLLEESELNPVSYYGRMKIMSEQALLRISNPLFAPTILRLATVFGYSYRPRFDLVVNSFAKGAFFKKEIKVFGGGQWRPHIHVSDVARAIVKILEAPIGKVASQIFNVGSSKENYTIDQLAEYTAQVFPKIKITRDENSPDVRNYRVSFDKFEQALGYKAGVSVLNGLEELKAVFERGEIKNPDDPVYSNFEAIKEFVSR